jgi:hypothetical protein
VVPERSIAALKVSSWRLMASGPFDLTGLRAPPRSLPDFSERPATFYQVPLGYYRIVPIRFFGCRLDSDGQIDLSHAELVKLTAAQIDIEI